MIRPASLLIVVMLSACANPAQAPSSTRTGPGQTIVADASPAPTPGPSVSTPTPEASATVDAGTPQPAEPDPTSAVVGSGLTDYERRLEDVLREDARKGCRPRRVDLPPGATAAVECQIASPLVERIAVYGFLALDGAPDGEQIFLDQAAAAYLDRMDQEGVLGAQGDCVAGTEQDVSWQGPEADSETSNGYIQVDYEGRTFSVFRYGCFLNDQGVANFRATCAEGTYVGVLGQTARLDELSAWALRWPDPENLSFSMPGICAGQQRDTP